MKEKKKSSLRTWIEEKWNAATDGTKGVCIGTTVGVIVTSIVAAIVSNHRENNWLDDQAIISKQDREFGYQMGLKDGQAKAYFELLTSPEKAFKKMGMTDIQNF